MNTPLNTPTVKSLLVSFYECRHIGLDILAISSPFFVGNKVPYARLTPSFESGYLNEKHMQTTCIDKSP